MHIPLVTFTKAAALGATALCALTLATVRCDDHDHDAGTDDPCGEPIYGGSATDEAWRTMVDTYGEAEVGSSEAVTVDAPAQDAALVREAPATFSWTSPIAALERVPARAARAARGDFDAGEPGRGRARERGWVEAIVGFFVGTARAHLPPITGDIYYVEISVPGRACGVRVLTTNETWLPDAATWQILASATGPLEMVVTSAYLSENRVTEGPYRPAAATRFTIP